MAVLHQMMHGAEAAVYSAKLVRIGSIVEDGDVNLIKELHIANVESFAPFLAAAYRLFDYLMFQLVAIGFFHHPLLFLRERGRDDLMFSLALLQTLVFSFLFFFLKKIKLLEERK